VREDISGLHLSCGGRVGVDIGHGLLPVIGDELADTKKYHGPRSWSVMQNRLTSIGLRGLRERLVHVARPAAIAGFCIT
jgi:hypothetical protein